MEESIMLKPPISAKRIAELLNTNPSVKEIRVSKAYRERHRKFWETLKGMGIRVVFVDVRRGRKPKYSEEVKRKAVERAQSLGIRKAARLLGIPKSTLMDWVSRWRKNHSL